MTSPDSAQPVHSAARRMLSYRWAIFGLLCTAYMLVVFHRMSTAVISNDLVDTFNISAASLGVLGSMYFYPYAVMQIPAGIMADTIGARKLVSFSLLLAGGGALLFAMAPDFKTAVVARLLIGLGLSCVFIPTLKILSIWFRMNEFATLSGIINSVGSLGGLIAAAPLAFFVLTIGWRNTIAVIGITTLVVAGIIYLIVRNNPKDMGFPTIEEIDGIQRQRGQAAEKIPPLLGLKLALSNRYAWPMYIRGFVGSAGWSGLQTLWGVPYLMQVVGLNKLQASGIMMTMAIGSMISSPIGGYLSDRVLHSRKKPVLFSQIATNLCWIPLAFYTDRLSSGFLLGLFLAMGLLGGLGTAGFAMVKELFPLSLAGTANGVGNFFGMFGSAVYQVLLGMIIEHYTVTTGVYPPEAFHAAFLFAFWNVTLSTVAVFFAKETMPQPVKTAAGAGVAK